MAVAKIPPKPASLRASKPEWYIYWALEQIGLKAGEDFVFQVPFGGGRLEMGGAVLDFYIPDIPLVISVQSDYYHYLRMEDKMQDDFIRIALETSGTQVVYIDEEDALREPMFYAREALNGIDHSRLGG